jgi:putative DNA primase/helicase
VPHNYVPQAPCKRWLEFFDEVFKGDKELIDYLQWALGYSITGDVSQHVFFMMYGKGRNGKGALIRAMAHALGTDYFTTLNPEELLAHKHARNSTAIAALSGLRFVACQETDKGKKLNEAQVKTLTGGDRLKARFLFKDEFEFDPTFKIWLATNHKPVIDGDGAQGNLWERLRLIPFLRQFTQEEKDTGLDAKLASESEGILAWLVEGAHRAANGKEPTIPGCVRAATNDYQKESDILGEFLEEVTQAIPAAKVLKSELHDTYCQWARTTTDFREFNKKLASRGMKDIRIGAGMAWAELAIRPEFISKNWAV